MEKLKAKIERDSEASPKGGNKKHGKVISLNSFIKQRNMRRVSQTGPMQYVYLPTSYAIFSSAY
jgi:hypothetical protein